MRTGALLCSLYLAPLAVFSAPIPVFLVEDLSALAKLHVVEPPLGQHPPAPVGTRPGQLRPEQWTASGKATFDNRPLPLPPAQFPASAVLSSPKPISTAELLALAAKEEAARIATTKPTPEAEPVKHPANFGGWNLDAMIAQMQESRGQSPSSLRMPCHLTTLVTEDHSDVLVLGLVMSFFMIIILLETWEAVWKSAQRLWRREAPIRLPVERRPCLRKLSFRDIAIPETIEEKAEI